MSTEWVFELAYNLQKAKKLCKENHNNKQNPCNGCLVASICEGLDSGIRPGDVDGKKQPVMSLKDIWTPNYMTRKCTVCGEPLKRTSETSICPDCEIERHLRAAVENGVSRERLEELIGGFNGKKGHETSVKTETET